MNTTTPAEPAKTSDAQKPFESKLTEGHQRFLAHVIDHSLHTGRRMAEDFIRYFPPAVIMNALRDQPALRANILVIATGVRSKIAQKKSAESAGQDLQIAMDEGEADADTVVTLFDPDDRVRFLDPKALWQFVIEGAFWQLDRDKDKVRHAAAADLVAFIVDRALRDRLLTHRDVIDGISVAKLSELLPRTELLKVLAAALKNGRENKAYTDSHLLGATPMATLVQSIPLPWIWEQVVVPKIAEAHHLVAKGAPAGTSPGAAAAPQPSTASVLTALQATPSERPPEPAGDLDLAVDDILGSLPEKPSPSSRPASKGKS